MKVRTVEELSDYMDNELAWRKKELSCLRSLATAPNQAFNKKNAILRSLITLTYAHWEGFIKTSASAYIEFVSQKKLPNSQLSPNFLDLSIRVLLMNASQSKKMEDHLKVINFFFQDMQSRSYIKYTVDTQSNLSSAIFHNIVTTLGFDYSLYQTKEKLLDETLLKTRNQIAHGEYIPMVEDDVLNLEQQCMRLMETFRDQIDNAAALESYKIP